MINFDNIKEENIKEHNPKWPKSPDYSYRILIIGDSGSGKTNSLFNLISYQPDTNKIYLYAKYPFEAKYQLLINKWERKGLKHLNDSKAFIEYSNIMNDIYKNIEEYNPNKKRIILINFDDMITDMLSNKTLQQVITELFIRGGNWAFLLLLSHNLVLLYQKILGEILHTILLWKFQINKSFNKLHLIIHQTLTLDTT